MSLFEIFVAVPVTPLTSFLFERHSFILFFWQLAIKFIMSYPNAATKFGSLPYFSLYFCLKGSLFFGIENANSFV